VHYPFSKGFHAWLDKHNRYSSMEAQGIVLQKAEPLHHSVSFYSKDPAMRRKALKSLLYRLASTAIIGVPRSVCLATRLAGWPEPD
jgi:hypothetical protein